MSSDQLRVRIVDTAEPRARQIQVLDSTGKVLGDLSKSVASVTYKMGVAGDIGIVQLELAVERAHIDSIEVPGMNAPLAVVRCTHPKGKACANCSPLPA